MEPIDEATIEEDACNKSTVATAFGTVDSHDKGIKTADEVLNEVAMVKSGEEVDSDTVAGKAWEVRKGLLDNSSDAEDENSFDESSDSADTQYVDCNDYSTLGGVVTGTSETVQNFQNTPPEGFFVTSRADLSGGLLDVPASSRAPFLLISDYTDATEYLEILSGCIGKRHDLLRERKAPFHPRLRHLEISSLEDALNFERDYCEQTVLFSIRGELHSRDYFEIMRQCLERGYLPTPPAATGTQSRLSTHSCRCCYTLGYASSCLCFLAHWSFLFLMCFDRYLNLFIGWIWILILRCRIGWIWSLILRCSIRVMRLLRHPIRVIRLFLQWMVYNIGRQIVLLSGLEYENRLFLERGAFLFLGILAVVGACPFVLRVLPFWMGSVVLAFMSGIAIMLFLLR